MNALKLVGGMGKLPRQRQFRRLSVTAPVLASLHLAGCGDSKDIVTTTGAAQANEPLYAIGSTQFGDDGVNTSYVALVPDLSAGSEIDYESVLELGGGSSLFGFSSGQFFALGQEESPTITRYEIDSNGSFREGDSLSLLNQGLSHMWFDPGLVPILSNDKAYIIDSSEMQVIVWNPSSMSLIATFSLLDAVDPNYPVASFEPDPTLRGDQLLVAVTHSAGDVTAPFSSVLVIDTSEDRLVNVAREERCGGLWDSLTDSEGDTYFSTGVWDAAQHRVLGNAIATEPCVVRVNAGASEFDGDFFVASSTLTEGRATGALVAGGGDYAYVKALDETELGDIQSTDFEAVWGGAHWRWWRVELGSAAPGAPVMDLPASGAAGGELFADGRAYARNATADFAGTTLLDMSQNPPTEQITVRGFPYGILRVR